MTWVFRLRYFDDSTGEIFLKDEVPSERSL
jgi:hypothetical protein